MGKVRVAGFAVSIDGFSAGPDQSLQHLLGKRGGELMNWFYPTRAFRSMIGRDGGTDDHFASAAMEGFGAPQHVRAGRRRLGRPRLEGLVGRRSALPRADFHPNSPRPSANRDGGRDNIPFRHWRNRSGTRPGQGRCRRPGCKDRWRRFDGPPVPARRRDRRVALGDVTRSSGPWRIVVRRHRPADSWLSGKAGGANGVGDPRRADALTCVMACLELDICWLTGGRQFGQTTREDDTKARIKL